MALGVTGLFCVFCINRFGNCWAVLLIFCSFFCVFLAVLDLTCSLLLNKEKTLPDSIEVLQNSFAAFWLSYVRVFEIVVR